MRWDTGSSPSPSWGGPTTRAASAVVNELYSHTFTSARGTPQGDFSRSAGSLPPGLSLSDEGVLSGTPTTVGSYTFTVKVDGGVFAPASEEFTLDVADNCPTIANNRQSNQDGDTLGNACDADRDGDTYDNGDDATDIVGTARTTPRTLARTTRRKLTCTRTAPPATAGGALAGSSAAQAGLAPDGAATSAARPPVRATSSSDVVGKTALAWPAAAQTVSYR